jgi:hypothetical protein
VMGGKCDVAHGGMMGGMRCCVPKQSILNAPM